MWRPRRAPGLGLVCNCSFLFAQTHSWKTKKQRKFGLNSRAKKFKIERFSASLGGNIEITEELLYKMICIALSMWLSFIQDFVQVRLYRNNRCFMLLYWINKEKWLSVYGFLFFHGRSLSQNKETTLMLDSGIWMAAEEDKMRKYHSIVGLQIDL